MYKIKYYLCLQRDRKQKEETIKNAECEKQKEKNHLSLQEDMQKERRVQNAECRMQKNHLSLAGDIIPDRILVESKREDSDRCLCTSKIKMIFFLARSLTPPVRDETNPIRFIPENLYQ